MGNKEYSVFKKISVKIRSIFWKIKGKIESISRSNNVEYWIDDNGVKHKRMYIKKMKK